MSRFHLFPSIDDSHGCNFKTLVLFVSFPYIVFTHPFIVLAHSITLVISNPFNRLCPVYTSCSCCNLWSVLATQADMEALHQPLSKSVCLCSLTCLSQKKGVSQHQARKRGHYKRLSFFSLPAMPHPTPSHPARSMAMLRNMQTSDQKKSHVLLRGESIYAISISIILIIIIATMPLVVLPQG